MTYAQVKKRWPNGWRNDEHAMRVVRDHAAGKHSLLTMNCPVCIRLWEPWAWRTHDDNAGSRRA